MLKHAVIKVNGIVQGVGFRPFIHKLVMTSSITGWIRNTTDGAEIAAEGPEEAIISLVGDIKNRHPYLADITSVSVSWSDDITGYENFRIISSDPGGAMNTLISPDVGICNDCRRELFDPSDRRYRYPFINCTNCGPRFTLIRDIPYDRKNTSMSVFPMCRECAEEYADIEDRRYHAQPDCCPVCGPHLSFLDSEGLPKEGDPLANAAAALKEGHIIAVKGLGGFHLACRADSRRAAEELRKRKHRDEKPLAVMARDIDTAGKIAVISPEEEAALNSFRKPIVLLRKKEGCSLDHLSDNNYIGIMLPYTPLHCLLLADGPELLVMTSANLSDLPIIYKNDQALKELHGIADGFLLHDREIVTRCDDSLIRIFRGREYPLRRSRGYVPYPVRIGTEGVRTDAGDSGGILACGAEQKASFALTKGDLVFTSQHIGDLKNIEAFDNYAGQIRHFEKMFDIEVNEIVCDLHPDLMSSDYARARASKDGIKLHMVQHHHAHMASCMADNSLSGKCIGIIWDGTGYGTDGTIWGGEFFTGDYTGFERAGSIRPVKLAGGDLAVREIWRCAAALLEDAGIDSREFFSGRLKGSKQDRLGAVISQLKMNINCPVSGGMGRLFDGVSAMLGLRYNVSYEGQGAVLLEAAAGSSEGSYPYAITEIYGPDGIVKRSEFDSRDMVRAICKDIEKGRDSSLIAADFMNTLVLMAVEMCEKIRKISGLSRVVLSGGTFQNMYLLERIVSGLSDAGFEVFTHRRAAANDEGISLGQAAIIFFSKKQI